MWVSLNKLKSIYVREALIPPIGRFSAPNSLVPFNTRIENGELKWDSKTNGRFVLYYLKVRNMKGKY